MGRLGHSKYSYGIEGGEEYLECPGLATPGTPGVMKGE